jgi:hypothetical protein
MIAAYWFSSQRQQGGRFTMIDIRFPTGGPLDFRAKSAGTLFLKTWAKLPGHIGNLLNTMAVLFRAETLFRSVLKSHLASKSA